MSSCEQIGATVHVPVCLADQINVEGLQVLLQIYLLGYTIYLYIEVPYSCMYIFNTRMFTN